MLASILEDGQPLCAAGMIFELRGQEAAHCPHVVRAVKDADHFLLRLIFMKNLLDILSQACGPLIYYEMFGVLQRLPGLKNLPMGRQIFYPFRLMVP